MSSDHSCASQEMNRTTRMYQRPEDILNNPDLLKVIVIGGGGLGKTTLVNLLTGATFQCSATSEDGTFDFQGATLCQNNREILIVDSLGFKLNEEKWWNGIMQIKNIIGVIIMHKYESRNSGYGGFGYVLAYLNKQKVEKIRKFLVDDGTPVTSENYMTGSIQVRHSGIADQLDGVRRWIEQLDSNKIEIFSPNALIDQYQRKLNEVESCRAMTRELVDDHIRTIERKNEVITTMKQENETLKEENADAEESYNNLERNLDELPEQLALYDPHTNGYLPKSPHWGHYFYSWLPIFGIFHLKSLRKQAEEDHRIAKKIIHIKAEKKKKKKAN